MRVFIAILIAVLLLFQYDFWFGKNGYFDYKKASAEIEIHQAEKEKLFQRNQTLSAEVKDLKEGFNAIQERARSQYEMVKPNETYYRITKENK